MPSNPAIGAADRTASSWPEALEKQREIILMELNEPECDEVFWREEITAVEQAQALYERSVAKHDMVIAAQQEMRIIAIKGIGDTIASRHPQANVAEFLRRDDPEGYLLW